MTLYIYIYFILYILYILYIIYIIYIIYYILYIYTHLVHTFFSEMHIKITLSRDNYVYILVKMYQAELHCLAPSTLHSLHRGKKKHLAGLPSC